MRIGFLIAIILATSISVLARLAVVIDPGHGGIDGGTSNGVSKESSLVLALAKIIEKKIQQDFNLASQIDVRLTRSQDQHLSLVQRIVPQFETPADLFLSLHMNYSSSKRVSGMEVYFDTSQRTARSLTKPNKLVDATDDKILKQILIDLSETGRNKWSQLFAETLREQWTLGSAKAIRVPFFVLNNNTAPAVLIEAGYLSNKNESQLLSEKQHQEIIADKIIKSLLTYKQIAYK
jgi:N-acetylmuramoyl-L-alanine amidase